jgi:hypothetical protein
MEGEKLLLSQRQLKRGYVIGLVEGKDHFELDFRRFSKVFGEEYPSIIFPFSRIRVGTDCMSRRLPISIFLSMGRVSQAGDFNSFPL